MQEIVILHLNGNNKDNSPENLEEVTRGELLLLNKYKGVSSNPDITKTNLLIAKLKLARSNAIRGTRIEKEDKKEKEKRYQQSEKGKRKACEQTQKYWKKHACDPTWREEYNKKQRERRKRYKMKNNIQ